MLAHCTMNLQKDNHEKLQFILEKVVNFDGEISQEKGFCSLVKCLINKSLLIRTKIYKSNPPAQKYTTSIFDPTNEEGRTTNHQQNDKEESHYLSPEVLVKIKKYSEMKKCTGRMIFPQLPIKEVFMNMLLNLNEDFDEDLLMDVMSLLWDEWQYIILQIPSIFNPL